MRLFYLATPLFYLWEAAGGAAFRVSALSGHTGWRILYYLLCFSAGLLCLRQPRSAAMIGLVESSINIFLLVLSVMQPYYAYIDAVAHDVEQYASRAGITSVEALNFAVSGAVLLSSFYGNPLFSRRRPPMQPGGHYKH